jgi:hypothetical protein
VPDEDDTGGELYPTKILLRATVEPSRDATEVGKKRMTAFDRTTNPADSRRPWFAASRGLHAEARSGRSILAGTVAIRPIGASVREVSSVRLRDRNLGRRWLDDQGLQHVLGLDAVVDVGGTDHCPQGHAVGVAGYMDGRTTLTTIDGGRPCVFAPFFDGFLEPSRRI